MSKRKNEKLIVKQSVRMLKKEKAERKSFKNLSQQRFSCQNYVQKSLELWRKKQAYSDVIEIIRLMIYKNRV